VILNHYLSLFSTDWDSRLDVVPIFLNAMHPLDLGLTPHNGIPRLTLPQLQRVGSCSFCYFMSFYWEIFLHDSYFSDKLIRCRSNVVNSFHIFLVPPWLLMSCSLFEKNIYSFYMAVFIHILCNVLSTITVNNSLTDSCHPKSGLSNTALIPRCWYEIMIMLSGPTIFLRNHCMNQS
jgi:hypothetical protein